MKIEQCLILAVLSLGILVPAASAIPPDFSWLYCDSAAYHYDAPPSAPQLERNHTTGVGGSFGQIHGVPGDEGDRTISVPFWIPWSPSAPLTAEGSDEGYVSCSSMEKPGGLEYRCRGRVTCDRDGSSPQTKSCGGKETEVFVGMVRIDGASFNPRLFVECHHANGSSERSICGQ